MFWIPFFLNVLCANLEGFHFKAFITVKNWKHKKNYKLYFWPNWGYSSITHLSKCESCQKVMYRPTLLNNISSGKWPTLLYNISSGKRPTLLYNISSGKRSTLLYNISSGIRPTLLYNISSGKRSVSCQKRRNITV